MNEPWLELITSFLNFLTTLLPLIGVLVGVTVTYVLTKKLDFANEQREIAKRFNYLLVKARKALQALEVDYKINNELTPKYLDEANVAQKSLIDYFDKESIILPQRLVDKLDKFIQVFVTTQSILVFNAHTGAPKKDEILKSLNESIASLQSAERSMRTEFKKIVGNKK